MKSVDASTLSASDSVSRPSGAAFTSASWMKNLWLLVVEIAWSAVSGASHFGDSVPNQPIFSVPLDVPPATTCGAFTSSLAVSPLMMSPAKAAPGSANDTPSPITSAARFSIPLPPC